MNSKSIINRICETVEDRSVGEILNKVRGIPEDATSALRAASRSVLAPQYTGNQGFSYRKHLEGGGTYAEIRFEARINGKTIFRSDAGAVVGKDLRGNPLEGETLKTELEHVFDEIVNKAEAEFGDRMWAEGTYRDIED